MTDDTETNASSAGAAKGAAGPPAEQTQDVPPELTTNAPPVPKKAEFGGPKGPEPTRYGDWERNGRCYDF